MYEFNVHIIVVFVHKAEEQTSETVLFFSLHLSSVFQSLILYAEKSF